MSQTVNNTITPEEAQIILQFLQRTQMQGAEMPAYVQIFNKLNPIAAQGAVKQVAVPEEAAPAPAAPSEAPAS